MSWIPDREMRKPVPDATVHVNPAVDETQVKVPLPVAEPYGRTLVPGSGLPSSHEFPAHRVSVPSVVMVTSCGGENETQRTWLDGLWAIRQATFPVGETNSPSVVAVASGWTAVAVVDVVVPAPGVGPVEPAGPVVVEDPWADEPCP